MSMPDFKYASLNAKLKGMNAKNLNKEELFDLIKQNNLKSAIGILKQEFKQIENINDDIDRMQLEEELDRIIINDINKILKYLNDKEKEIFYLYISKFELRCIEQVVKNIIFDNERNKENIKLWTESIFKKIKNIEESKNEDDFIRYINKSKYHDFIKEYLIEIEGINNIQVSDFELKLDNKYYKDLYEKAKNYDENLKDLIGKQITLTNIISIYRLKKYYNYDAEKIKERIIPENYKINPTTMNKLINADNYEDMKSILEKTIYKKVFENTKEEDLEKNINIFIYKQYKKVLMQTQYNVATVIAYVALSEIQKRNIINILEGITYGLDKKDIENKIII